MLKQVDSLSLPRCLLLLQTSEVILAKNSAYCSLMQWNNDTWLLLAHHPYPEGVLWGTFIMRNNVVTSSWWWFYLRCTQVSKLSLWMGNRMCIQMMKVEGKTRNYFHPVFKIDCWLNVPYVTVSPFWWNIQRQRELKVIRICVWRSSRWCASKDFREQMFEIISTTHNNKGSSLLTVFQRHRGFTVCDSSTLHGQDGKVYIVKSVWKVFWLYDDLLWLESLIDGWGQT